MKVAISIDEHYPHTFVTDDPDEITERAEIGNIPIAAVIEITDAEWSAYREASRVIEWWLERFRERAGVRE